MKIYTSEVEMLRAQCRQWEKVCDSHLRLIKKLKKERQWVGLTNEEKKSFWTADQMTQEEWDELFAAVEAKLKEKNT